MESIQGSWQFENISSANEISPPLSPAAPPSPTLYSLNLSQVPYKSVFDEYLGDDAVITNGVEPFEGYNIVSAPSPVLTNGVEPFEGYNIVSAPSPFLSNIGADSFLCPPAGIITVPRPSGTASVNSQGQANNSLPNDLSDVDMRWAEDEPSLNLEIEDLLAGLDEAQVSQITDELHTLSNGEEVKSEESSINEESCSLSVTEQPVNREEHLNASFNDILKELGLSESQGAINVIDAVELIALKDEGLVLGLENIESMQVDDEDSQQSSSASTSYCQSPSSSVQENEMVVYETDDSQDTFVLEDVQEYTVIVQDPAHDSDSEDDAQDNTLNALLRGDSKAARSLYPAATFCAVRAKGQVSDSSVTTLGGGMIAKAKQSLVKPERRGRKPSSANNGKAWVHLKDKTLRKKEQNKTAATRYRQKKKAENTMYLEKEAELAEVHDKIMKEKEDLAREIKFTKELLRKLLQARKKKQ